MRQSPWRQVVCPKCDGTIGNRCRMFDPITGFRTISHVHVARVKLAKSMFKPSGEGYARVR